ncbi:MAG: exonuclease domain-containing protein [Phaeodactylibacter xiamenensis]|uniref:DNA polymerase III subunit epsilon n=1 Tax=Phaeodactylibacter xiamenensis TaxID=1524460 RepID=A0A098S107_9BACT|nr:3'-5' exonuclease [Phaeodactylibacter xiamenensis]KGE85791.1 DNA polymerase III subunit epsilon [Phaeodactylibacter xiamenensis]
MDFNLDRDLIFFDLEATGLSVVRDRIIQIAMVKYPKKGGEPQELSMLINPGIPISEEAMEVHGITPKDVANKPTFQQVAEEIYNFIGNADLAGYNSNRFDIPMLMEEFDRVGIEFNIDNRRSIDVQRIFYKMEPRNLKAAVRFYCNKEMENAHDALADVYATIDVFKGQLEKYRGVDYEDDDGNITPTPVTNDMQVVHDFTNDLRYVDATQKMKYDVDGSIVFSFGKYNGKPVGETLSKDKQYFNWILNKEFSSQVKQIVKRLVREYENQ